MFLEVALGLPIIKKETLAQVFSCEFCEFTDDFSGIELIIRLNSLSIRSEF